MYHKLEKAARCYQHRTALDTPRRDTYPYNNIVSSPGAACKRKIAGCYFYTPKEDDTMKIEKRGSKSRKPLILLKNL